MLHDQNFVNILYEYAMNYSTETLRKNYTENKKKQAEKVTRDELRELGYSEEDLKDVEV